MPDTIDTVGVVIVGDEQPTTGVGPSETPLGSQEIFEGATYDEANAVAQTLNGLLGWAAKVSRNGWQPHVVDHAVKTEQDFEKAGAAAWDSLKMMFGIEDNHGE